MDGEEFLLGTSIGGPTRSKGADSPCRGYHEGLPTPTWDSLLTLLAKEKIHTLNIMFLGKVGSDGRCGAVGFCKTTRQDIQNAPLSIWTPGQGKLTGITMDPDNTALFAKEVCDLYVEPQHVVGIIVRKLS
jgi:hypothetical protein